MCIALFSATTKLRGELCWRREMMLDCENRLRAEAKRPREYKLAAELAQFALIAQRARQAHEGTCRLCTLLESEAAA